MRKKLFLLLLAAAMTALVLCGCKKKSSPVKDFDYQNDGGTVVIPKYNGTDEKVVIPAKIDGKPVTAVGDEAFYENAVVTHITIPDSVEQIGGYAFGGCAGLEEVTIGKGVTYIDYGAFEGCAELKKITLPDGVTEIGGRAFSGCTSLTGITLGKDVAYIGGYAFYGCTSLKKIKLPDALKEIGVEAFYGCTALTEIKYKGKTYDYEHIDELYDALK